MILAGVQLDERRLIGNVLFNLRPSKRQQMRWAMVREAFEVTSTVAYAMCREFKLDPEEKMNP